MFGQAEPPLFANTGAGITCKQLDSEQYIARYIVAKRESFSRIRFITSAAFPNALDDYGRLHIANTKWFAEQHSAFYADIMTEPKRVAVLLKDFYKQVGHTVKWRVEKKFKGIEKFDEEPLLYWNKTKAQLEVGYFEDAEVLAYMNKTPEVREVIAVALKNVYRYTGPFNIDLDIPF